MFGARVNAFHRFVDIWSSVSSDLFLASEVLGVDPLHLKGDSEPPRKIHRDVELRYNLVCISCS